MHNQDSSAVFVGIDVSAQDLAVAVHTDGQFEAVRSFANTAAGHRHLLGYLGRHRHPVRVCVEASGNYVFIDAIAPPGWLT